MQFRWVFSPDDIAGPSVLAVVQHVLLVTAASVTLGLRLGVEDARPDADPGRAVPDDRLTTYLLLFLVLFVVQLVCEVLLVRASMASPSSLASRSDGYTRLLKALLTLRLVLFFCDLALACYGVYAAVSVEETFVIDTDYVIAVLLAINFVSSLLSVSTLLLGFGCCVAPRADSQSEWQRFCALFFCTVSGPRDEVDPVFELVGDLCHEFFQDLNMLPGDIAASLYLVRLTQKRLEELRTDNPEYGARAALPAGHEWIHISHPMHGVPMERNSPDFQDLLYHYRFANGAYGWPLYVFTHPVSSVPILASKMCCSFEPAKVKRVGDSCCFCLPLHSAALLYQSKLQGNDVIHANFRARLMRPAYVVVLDRERNTVVVSVRGTLSMDDTATDAVGLAEPFDAGPEIGTAHGHKGMVQSASWIRSDLAERGVLDDAMIDGRELRVTGHSLGAGTAAILALMLRPQYPSLHCLVYGCPAVVDARTAELAKPFITTLVHSKDMIPRLSLRNISIMKEILIKVSNLADSHKSHILSSPFRKNVTMETIFADPDAALQAVLDTELDTAGDTSVDPLRAPGKILFFHYPTRPRPYCCFQSNCCRPSRRYTAHWIEADQLGFIQVSSRAIKDHVPWLYGDAIKLMARQLEEDEDLRQY